MTHFSPRPAGLFLLALSLGVGAGVAPGAEPDGAPRHILDGGHSGPVIAVALSPDGKTLASCGDDRTIRLWDVPNRKHLATIRAAENYSILSVCFSPDGKTLASAGDDATVKLWDLEAGKEKAELAAGKWRVTHLAFSPDGATLAACGEHVVRRWDVGSGKELGPLKGHTAEVWGVAFTADGKSLVSGGFDKSVRLWDLATGEEKGRRAGKAEVHGFACGPGGKVLAWCDLGGGVTLADPATLEEAKAFRGHREAARCAAFTPGGTLLAWGTGGTMSRVEVWDAATGALQEDHPGANTAAASVALRPDGKEVALGWFQYETVVRYELPGGKKLPGLEHTRSVYSVAYSPAGDRLAAGTADGEVYLWDLAAGKWTAKIGQPRSGSVYSVAFSGDGKTVAAGSIEKLWLYSGEGGKEAVALPLPTRDTFVALDPAGAFAASAGEDKIVRLWDVKAGKEIVARRGHADRVRCLAFSPDGKRLASGDAAGVVKLWNVEGKELLTLRGHDTPIKALAFSADGKTLRAAAWDYRVITWDVDVKEQAP